MCALVDGPAGWARHDALGVGGIKFVFTMVDTTKYVEGKNNIEKNEKDEKRKEQCNIMKLLYWEKLGIAYTFAGALSVGGVTLPKESKEKIYMEAMHEILNEEWLGMEVLQMDVLQAASLRLFAQHVAKPKIGEKRNQRMRRWWLGEKTWKWSKWSLYLPWWKKLITIWVVWKSSNSILRSVS